MSKKYIVELTEPQIDALMTAASAMLAGEEGEGDFLCAAAALDRAADALAGAKLKPKKHQNGKAHRG